MSGVTQFKNCRILRNHRLIREDLWVEDGRIINPEELFYIQKRPPSFAVDCQNAVIAPGFIDVQINGGFGYDFSFDEDKTEEAVSVVARGILAHGVTSFLPTMITCAPSVYRKVLPLLKKRPGGKEGAGVLGAHLEGPFISKEKKGAHPEQHIHHLDEGFATMKDVYGCLDNVAMVTLAPELPNALDAVRSLTDRGIVVSVGHSAGSIVDGEKAFECGARFMTHLFNAMTKFHHRDPGIIGMLTSKMLPLEELWYGIISDGIHTHPAALRIAYKTHPIGLCLVTDAVSAMGLGSGRHHIGDMDVEIQGEQAVIAGTETLCGSIVTMDSCIRHLIHSARQCQMSRDSWCRTFVSSRGHHGKIVCSLSKMWSRGIHHDLNSPVDLCGVLATVRSCRGVHACLMFTLLISAMLLDEKYQDQEAWQPGA